jgi:hypothetical protein
VAGAAILGGGDHFLESFTVTTFTRCVVNELGDDPPALFAGELTQLAKLVFNVLPSISGAYSAVDGDGDHAGILQLRAKFHDKNVSNTLVCGGGRQGEDGGEGSELGECRPKIECRV